VARSAATVGGSDAVADAEQQADAVGRQPATDEGQGGQRLLVDPLRVVDHTEQTLVGGHLGRSGQQGETGEPDQEAVGRSLVVEPEGRPEGGALGARQLVEAVEERAQQAVQTRVAQVALGLDAGDPDAAQARGRAHHVLEQAGLAHPGLAVDDARPADTARHRGDQVVEGLPLVDAIQQCRLAIASGGRRHRRRRRHGRSRHPLPASVRLVDREVPGGQGSGGLLRSPRPRLSASGGRNDYAPRVRRRPGVRS